MSVKTGCLHQFMMNSFSKIHPLQVTRPCFSIRRNLHLATYFPVFEKYNQTHLFPSTQKKTRWCLPPLFSHFQKLKNLTALIFENYAEKFLKWTVNNLNFDQTGLRKMFRENHLFRLKALFRKYTECMCVFMYICMQSFLSAEAPRNP